MTVRIGFVFPGQGSQSVGMGREWAEQYPAARRVFEEADQVLGLSLAELCWQGPEEDLQLTANTQPALLTVSIAILRVLQDLGIRPSVVAGHSLGEYSALVAANCLDLKTALTLVRQRGEAMQQAVPVGEGAMAAILGLAAEEVEKAVDEAAGTEICSIANYNAPGQIVIAGHTQAVERAVGICKDRGARRAVLLPVSAPFHCSLMAPAREHMTPALEGAAFKDPTLPVVSNIDARPVQTAEEARQALRRQIDGPVRWIESVEWMVGEAEVDLFLEVGSGKVLTGLNRRIAPSTKTLSLSEPGGLAKVQERLAESV